MYESDPDWAPSLHLGHSDIKQTDTARSARRDKRDQQRRNTAQTAELKVWEAEVGKHLHITEETHEAGSKDRPGHTVQEVAVAECNLCLLRRAEINRLIEENIELRRELDECRMSDRFFGEDDDKVKYYTGLPNPAAFMALLHFLLPHLSNQKKILAPFQMLLLTFMRLRLDLPVQHLAHLFRVSQRTVYKTFAETVSLLYANLKHFIVWPGRDTLHKVMPHKFVEAFGQRVAVIIDCFEILTEKPSNQKARAQMFSSNKQSHTMKYLIGITPGGFICFLSKGWGGRTSDKHITLNSGFLNNLLPGDIVLADRGFDIKEGVGMLCAEVNLPAFTQGHCQLVARDVEETKKIAHLRIHVERVIRNVRQKFKFLTRTVPITTVLQCDSEDVTFLDKIVTVCCALTNQCPSVV